MSFGYVSDLPRLENYEQALTYFNQTKGVRGRTHIKPLKINRRDPDSYQIDVVKVGDAIVAVQCWLYNTPVLEYYKDRIVVNTWNSRTTCGFVDSIAPYWLQAGMRQDRMRLFVRGEGQFMSDFHKNESVTIHVDNQYAPIKGGVKAGVFNEVVLNRTRAAAARKELKPIMELARATSKLDGYWLALRQTSEEIEDETMCKLRALLDANGYSVREGWNGSTVHSMGHVWGMASQEQLLPTLKKRAYLYAYRANNCYDRAPAPYGVIPKNWELV